MDHAIGISSRLAEAVEVVERASPDLDAYVQHLDKQPQDSAIVRKALGQAYQDTNEHAKAIKQLQLAVQLQPNDAETQKLLVEAFDKHGDKEAAVKALQEHIV